jgi:hypothetical protein
VPIDTTRSSRDQAVPRIASDIAQPIFAEIDLAADKEGRNAERAARH